MNKSITRRRQCAAVLVLAMLGAVGSATAKPESGEPAPFHVSRIFLSDQTPRADTMDQPDTDLSADLACVPADESQGVQCAGPNAVNDERSYDRELIEVMLALHGRRPMRAHALAHACATGILDLALDEEFAANAMNATSYADSP